VKKCAQVKINAKNEQNYYNNESDIKDNGAESLNTNDNVFGNESNEPNTINSVENTNDNINGVKKHSIENNVSVNND